jgi:hypothetical protein
VKSEQNALNISAQYGYPFSLSLHWYSTANLAIPFAGKEKKANQYIQSALYYQLGEKIHNELNVSLSKYHQFQTSGSAPDTDHSSSDFNIGNTVRYFIENNVNVSVSISYFDRVERTEMIGFTSRNTSSGFNVNFGINYRFF